ncbi:MAG: hypothetical protein NVSMB64_22570 [Candidatus Velthaea sp.]
MQAASGLDLRLIVEAMPLLCWSADARGAVTFVNGRWSDFTGVAPEDAGGDGWMQMFDPAYRTGVEVTWRETLAAGRAIRFEARAIAASGASRWMRLRCIPIRDENGQLAAWLGTATDIDDERRAADRLRISAAANAALAQSTGLDATLATLSKLIVPELADWFMINLLEGDSMVRVALCEHRDPACAPLVATVLHATMHLHGGGNSDVMRFTEPRVYPHLAFDQVAPQMRANGVAGNISDTVRQFGWQSAVFVPLIHRGRAIGVMQAVRSTTSTVGYDGRDVPVFTDIAAAAANAISNAQIFDALLDSERHLAVVSRASSELARSLSLRETFETLVRIVVPELADWASVTVRDRGGLRTVAAVHADPAQAEYAARLLGPFRGDAKGGGGTANVMRTGRSEFCTLVEDVMLQQFMTLDAASVIPELGLKSTVDVPLIVDGETYGVLSIGSTSFQRLYTPSDLPLFEELAHRAAATIANARRYEHEHRVATALQAGALPKSLPDSFGFKFSGHYAPGRTELQIGGDWYDALRLEDGRIVISIGDVLGSGLDAAVTMGNLRQIIRGVAQVHPDPALMLDAADKTLRADQPDRIVTAFVGVLDPVNATLTYASAGHPPALLRAEYGAIEELRTTGLPLGLRERDESVTRTIAVPPGSLLVFYTDGLTESTRDLIEGERRLRAALAKPAVLSAANVAQAIHDDVLFDGSHDDVAILAIRVPHPSVADPLVRWSCHSTNGDRAAAVRHELAGILERRGASENARFVAELVLGELIGNVARYAPGKMDISLDLSGSLPVLHVLDEGEGFRYLPKLPDDVLSERGRGLYIISQMTADFTVVARGNAGSHARAVLDV